MIEASVQIAIDGKVSNWTGVSVAAGVGFVTGGFGGVIGKAVAGGLVSAGQAVVATAAVSGAATAVGKVVEGELTGKPATSKEVAVAAVAGAVGGMVGSKVGLSTEAKVATMASKPDIAGHVGQTTQAAMQQGGKISEPATSAGQKAGQRAADLTSTYVEKKVNN